MVERKYTKYNILAITFKDLTGEEYFIETVEPYVTVVHKYENRTRYTLKEALEFLNSGLWISDTPLSDKEIRVDNFELSKEFLDGNVAIKPRTWADLYLVDNILKSTGMRGYTSHQTEYGYRDMASEYCTHEKSCIYMTYKLWNTKINHKLGIVDIDKVILRKEDIW